MDILVRLEAEARAGLPSHVYDYYAGGAGDEQTLAENRQAWRRLWIRPRVMVDVSEVDTSCTVLGLPLSMPVLLAPLAAQRLLHPAGEPAAARAAAAAGTVFSLATRATTDLADVAAQAPGPLWLQLYVEQDHALTKEVLARAAEHGYRAILLTVDLPVAGRRERELRHGDLPLPAHVRLADHRGGERADDVKAVAGWDAALTWEDLGWIREAAGLPIIIKGVLCAEDAAAALEAGADGVVVSNHGGRQIDGCLPTAVALQEVAAEVGGRAAVLVDGGIRDGADVLRALALGADAVLIGRPYAWGLAAQGETGVRAVLDAFADDLRRTLALSGCRTPGDVTFERVKLAGW